MADETPDELAHEVGDEEEPGAGKPDPDRLKQFLRRAGADVAAGFNCAITVLGDRLDLYQALDEQGPSTSAELARATDLHERWVREWLQHQACAGQIEFDAASARFRLSPEARAVLVDADHPAFLMGAYDAALSVYPAVEHLQEAFRTGLGMSYDDHGPSCACAIERMGAFTKNHRLVPDLIPQVGDMDARLRTGAQVADVGCGGALSTIAMAQRYPASTFVGYDVSEHALTRARANLAESRLANVTLLNPLHTPLPDAPTYDFVTTFDVVHDTPYPAALIAQIHAALKTDGVWLCEDIRGFETFAENLEKHPLAAMLYGFSVMVCMNAGMAEPDGAGLGTLGFTEETARRMTQAAGFTAFTRLDIDNPMNSYYVLTKA
ncbi:MAG: class I SAM-dependent methyltransferase [Pseudomonadota bacterium]